MGLKIIGYEVFVAGKGAGSRVYNKTLAALERNDKCIYFKDACM
jgi:hypothetical protein